jgi:hypothetical protein
VGGSGCAANCTTESALPVNLGDASRVIVQTLGFGLNLKLSGTQIFTAGQSRDVAVHQADGRVLFGPGEIPVVLRAADINVDPVIVQGLICACPRGQENLGFGPGNAAAGKIGCSAGGLTNTNVTALSDHNAGVVGTDLTAEQCQAEHYTLDPITDLTPRDNVLPVTGSVQLGNDPENDANACSVVNLLEFSGMGTAGSAVMRLNVSIGLLLDGGTCCTVGEPDCMAAGQGPDGKPCTADDTASSFGAVVPLVTGVATAELRNANNVAGTQVAQGSLRPCATDVDCKTADITDEKCADTSGASAVPCAGAANCQCRVACGKGFCSTAATGREFTCPASADSPAIGASGSCLVGVFAQVDVPLVGDLVTTTQFCIQ